MSSLIAPSKRDFAVLIKRTYASGSSPLISIPIDFLKYQRYRIIGRLLLAGVAGDVTNSVVEIRNATNILTDAQAFKHTLAGVVTTGTGTSAMSFVFRHMPRENANNLALGLNFELTLEQGNLTNWAYLAHLKTQGYHTLSAPVYIDQESTMILGNFMVPDRINLNSNGNGNWRSSSYYTVYGEKCT